jgi:plastocyanin
MKRIGFAFGSALVAVTLAASGCGGGEEASDTTTSTTEPTTTTTALKGTVGPGFDISLTAADGQPLGTLAPGTVELDVEDKASIHNFHLTGPGVDVMTEVGGEGTSNFQIELQPGTYNFVCDPHASTMNGSFEVSG